MPVTNKVARWECIVTVGYEMVKRSVASDRCRNGDYPSRRWLTSGPTS